MKFGETKTILTAFVTDSSDLILFIDPFKNHSIYLTSKSITVFSILILVDFCAIFDPFTIVYLAYKQPILHLDSILSCKKVDFCVPF